MRARTIKYQYATVRPLVPQDDTTKNVFGDATVITSITRTKGFKVKMQVSWTRGVLGESGTPGRDRTLEMIIIVTKRDIRESTNPTWEPKSGDLIDSLGQGLFVSDVQPALPRRASRIGDDADGGWDGYRLMLKTRDPVQSQAGTYE